MKVGRNHISIASPLASASHISATAFTSIVVLAVACLLGSAPSLAQKAYITGGEGNLTPETQTVTIIDTTTDTVLATLSGSSFSAPTSVAVKPDGSKAYVTNDGNATTSVIDGVNNTLLKTIQGTGNVGAAVSPDGTKVYVSGFINTSYSGVTVIDTSSDAVIATIPITVAETWIDAISPDGSTLYVAIGNPAGYVVISTASNTITNTVLLPNTAEQMGMQVSPDGSKLYIGSLDCRCVLVMSTATNTQIASIPFTQGVVGLALSIDGSNIYVTYGGSPMHFAVIAASTNMVTTDIALNGTGPAGGLAITPDGSRLYILDGAGQSVAVVSTSTNQIVDNIAPVNASFVTPTGIFIALPTHATISPAPKTGTTCNGVYNGTFKGSITVSSGQNCQFVSGGQITGNIAVTGGNVGLNGASVGGSVNITGGAFSLTTATIGGNLELTNIPAGNTNNSICGTQVTGNMKFDQNGVSVQIGSNSPMTCAGNNIGGNMEALANMASTLIFNNTVTKNLTASNNTGPLDVVGNNVGATLTCQGNTNLVMGGGNTAKKKSGQCN
jgi:YVTN family beta-propeller protein